MSGEFSTAQIREAITRSEERLEKMLKEHARPELIEAERRRELHLMRMLQRADERERRESNV